MHLPVRPAALGFLCLLGIGAAMPALAQRLSDAELDRLSQERMQTLPHRDYGPPPPLSSIPRTPVYPTAEPVTCLSTTPYQPILQAPAAGSPAIGKTLTEVAATNTVVAGYRRILFHGSVFGFIPDSSVHPFRSTIKPGLTCKVEGVRANGIVQFRYGP